MINFDISLPKKCFKHLKDISTYNNNYYEVEFYGDWFYGELDIIFQEYDEFSNVYLYRLGKMVKAYEPLNPLNRLIFKPFVFWASDKDIFKQG